MPYLDVMARTLPFSSNSSITSWVVVRLSSMSAVTETVSLPSLRWITAKPWLSLISTISPSGTKLFAGVRIGKLRRADVPCASIFCLTLSVISSSPSAKRRGMAPSNALRTCWPTASMDRPSVRPRSLSSSIISGLPKGRLSAAPDTPGITAINWVISLAACFKMSGVAPCN